VTVAVAKGKKGKHFRTLGKPKVNSKGVITLRFRLKLGTYRMRYSFKARRRRPWHGLTTSCASSASLGYATPKPHSRIRSVTVRPVGTDDACDDLRADPRSAAWRSSEATAALRIFLRDVLTALAGM